MSRECVVCDRAYLRCVFSSRTHMYLSLFSIEIEYDTEVVTENEANKKTYLHEANCLPLSAKCIEKNEAK